MIRFTYSYVTRFTDVEVTCLVLLIQMYPGSRSSPILSKSSAPGIIMASGVVGKSLKDNVSVYVSTTAGSSWYNVLPG